MYNCNHIPNKNLDISKLFSTFLSIQGRRTVPTRAPAGPQSASAGPPRTPSEPLWGPLGAPQAWGSRDFVTGVTPCRRPCLYPIRVPKSIFEIIRKYPLHGCTLGVLMHATTWEVTTEVSFDIQSLNKTLLNGPHVA